MTIMSPLESLQRNLLLSKVRLKVTFPSVAGVHPCKRAIKIRILVFIVLDYWLRKSRLLLNIFEQITNRMRLKQIPNTAINKLLGFLITLITFAGFQSFASENPLSLADRIRIERRLHLPQLPKPEVNDQSLVGIDRDLDQIRDDVQRQIAFAYFPDMNKIKLANEYARSLQLILGARVRTRNSNMGWQLAYSNGCLHTYYPDELDSIKSNLEAWVFNTSQRKTLFQSTKQRLVLLPPQQLNSQVLDTHCSDILSRRN